ncbi:MAG TPA: hypothetical protein VLG08_02335, partial [Casimicrobiaceae bacterium]|nr:hypothetical protein [Casimicrobiaceae bacterium]
MTSARPGTPGATRACPHCRETILESAVVCPGCKHYLRFGAGGDASPARPVQQIRILALLFVHRVVNRAHPAHLLLDVAVSHVHLLGELAHARDHPHDLVHGPKLLHLGHLAHEVFERERPFLHLGLELGRLLGV